MPPPLWETHGSFPTIFNYTKAFDWYRKGADGNMQARKRLADCYALGIGTKQSLRKAHECGEYYTLDLQNTYCRYYA